MNVERFVKEKLLIVLNEIKALQKKRLLECGRSFVPHLTEDDILQPNDFAELEENPFFRYEEGVLAGIQMVESAILSEN